MRIVRLYLLRKLFQRSQIFNRDPVSVFIAYPSINKFPDHFFTSERFENIFAAGNIGEITISYIIQITGPSIFFQKIVNSFGIIDSSFLPLWLNYRNRIGMDVGKRGFKIIIIIYAACLKPPLE